MAEGLDDDGAIARPGIGDRLAADAVDRRHAPAQVREVVGPLDRLGKVDGVAGTDDRRLELVFGSRGGVIAREWNAALRGGGPEAHGA